MGPIELKPIPVIAYPNIPNHVHIGHTEQDKVGDRSIKKVEDGAKTIINSPKDETIPENMSIFLDPYLFTKISFEI
jgi:hypothetical protein